MNLPPLAYAALAVSVIAALLLDYAVVRFAPDWLKPPSVYLFWIGRLAKLAILLAWIGFFNGYWYPQFVGTVLPSMVTATEWAVAGVFVFLAAMTLPRALAIRGRDNG